MNTTPPTVDEQQPAPDENHIIAERREKLAKLRQAGVPFPNDFIPTHLAADLHDHYDGFNKEELASKKIGVKVAGRMVSSVSWVKLVLPRFKIVAVRFSSISAMILPGSTFMQLLSIGIWATLLPPRVIFLRPIKASSQSSAQHCAS